MELSTKGVFRPGAFSEYTYISRKSAVSDLPYEFRLMQAITVSRFLTFLVGPGEWIRRTSELSGWFRTRFQHQALSILDFLQNQNYITHTRFGRGHLIKFCITGWKKHNTALDYNYPCQKDVGFFFFPVATVHEPISMGKCSEMDIIPVRTDVKSVNGNTSKANLGKCKIQRKYAGTVTNIHKGTVFVWLQIGVNS